MWAEYARSTHKNHDRTILSVDSETLLVDRYQRHDIFPTT